MFLLLLFFEHKIDLIIRNGPKADRNIKIKNKKIAKNCILSITNGKSSYQ